MNSIRFIWVLFGLVFLLPVRGTAASATYSVGDTFAAFSTEDQHEQAYTYPGGARTVVVSFAMGTGKAANAYLEKQGAAFLAEHQALYIANIYGMPWIGRIFAMPAMRKYPHRILLADEEHFLDRYPMQEGRLTVLRLDGSDRITAIEFVDPETDMATIFSED